MKLFFDVIHKLFGGSDIAKPVAPSITFSRPRPTPKPINQKQAWKKRRAAGKR